MLHLLIEPGSIIEYTFDNLYLNKYYEVWKTRTKSYNWIDLVFGIILTIVSIYLFYFSDIDFFTITLFLFGIYFIIKYFYLKKYLWLKKNKKLKELNTKVKVEISSENIKFITSKTESTIQWDRFYKYLIFEDGILLFPSLNDNTFYYLPGNILNTEQINYIESCLKK